MKAEAQKVGARQRRVVNVDLTRHAELFDAVSEAAEREMCSKANVILRILRRAFRAARKKVAV